MRVLMFGAGSIGCVIGALLSAENDVTLLTRGEHLDAIRKNGLVLQGLLEDKFDLNAVSSVDAEKEYDAVIITTKSYDTKAAAEECTKMSSSDTTFISLQNGLGNAEILSDHVPAEKIAVGSTSMGAHRVSPGVIRYVASGEIVLGPFIPGSGSDAVALNLFRSSDIQARNTENIQGILWSKAIVNSAINTITAILGCENGAIAENEELRSIAHHVCTEGESVAATQGVRLEPPNVWDYLMEIARDTAKNRSSMLLDMEMGRRTEIEEISGGIVEAARENEIETPVTSALLSMVRFLESRNRYQKA